MAVKARSVVLGKADLQFQIDQLRQDKLVYGVEALVISFLAVLTAVFLPEILYRLVLGSGKLQVDPAVLSWIPVVSYVVAATYTVYALVGNLGRLKKIKKLESDLANA